MTIAWKLTQIVDPSALRVPVPVYKVSHTGKCHMVENRLTRIPVNTFLYGTGILSRWIIGLNEGHNRFEIKVQVEKWKAHLFHLHLIISWGDGRRANNVSSYIVYSDSSPVYQNLYPDSSSVYYILTHHPYILIHHLIQHQYIIYWFITCISESIFWFLTSISYSDPSLIYQNLYHRRGHFFQQRADVTYPTRKTLREDVEMGINLTIISKGDPGRRHRGYLQVEGPGANYRSATRGIGATCNYMVPN